MHFLEKNDKKNSSQKPRENQKEKYEQIRKAESRQRRNISCSRIEEAHKFMQ